MDNRKVTGRIFDIQRYSVHDGPGIRTIVFLKGCFLRCRWCSNPESQSHEIETMIQNGKERLSGRDVTVEEVLLEVEKDRAYYRKSGGGLTLSGGEVLYQPEFTHALLAEAKESGIHTAIETTAFAKPEMLRQILPELDLCLLDIKHIDSAKHREFTGVNNEQILENARMISLNEQNTELIIRVPVIPGFNDTQKEIGQIADFASGLQGVKELHLLPYHRLGQDKYHMLNRTYQMPDILPPDRDKMENLLNIVNKYGLLGQIGG